MKRIFVFGGVGVGKTTFASKLSKILGIEFFKTDDMIWNENWKKRKVEERDKKLKEILRKKKWIIEGAQFDEWIFPAIKKSDTVILLNFGRKVMFKRVIKRFKKGRKDKGAYGKIGSLVYLLYYVLTHKSKSYLERKEVANGEFILLENDVEADRFLEKILNS
tara:strand:- start:242 stop:730 length:489 start_codon:yes stop_codon:yes gene_type:complete